MPNYRYMTEDQANFIATLVDARYEEDSPEREPLREEFRAIRTNDDVTRMLIKLRAVPTLNQKRRAAERAEREATRPTEEGLYRDPATGELFRMKRNKGGEMIVSKYSATGGPRRLIADGTELTKGSWKRYTTFQSRIALLQGKIKKDWLISAKELATEYAYGFCPLHYGPLTDGVSVALGYGPDCAEKHGLPWGEEVAKRKIAERQALANTSG